MQLFKKKKKENKGFTLVELVVVILVIAILATATFLGGATVIKQARLSKVQGNLSNYATYVQDMFYAEPGVVNKDAASAETLLNNKYLTKDFQLGDMKDSWGNNYNFKFATGTVDDADSKTHKYTYTIINSNGANGRDESANVTTVLSGADYVSAQDAVDTATLTTGDDIGVIIILRDGAVSTAYYGTKDNVSNNSGDDDSEEPPVVLTAGLYTTGHAGDSSYLIKSWEDIKKDYPNAITETEIKSKDHDEFIDNYNSATLSYFNKTLLAGDLVIPNNITTIDDAAFFGCANLTSITIPNSVTSIGKYAFGKCTGIKTIIIPNEIETIDRGAFGSSGLTSIIIPDNIKSIGRYTFSGCTGLTSITIPNSVTSIDHGAFLNCTGLTSMVVPNSLNYVGDGLFEGCTKLSDVQIQEGITELGKEMFSSSGLTTITLPSTLEKINLATFNGCTKLKSITIPDGVTTIDENAFRGCLGLTSITIPNGVTTIGFCAFYNCTNLTTIQYSGTATGSPWGAESATIVP